ncbi:hypothetical protein KY346_01345 [Candidatus Woesearchaeota archaeon]|nr:hypothetical protein [Candidatus Woesearchaeota archaeon]
MRFAVIFAIVLLAAIIMAGFYADNIKSYAVKSMHADCENGLCYGCVLNGVPCTCYSKECVCGNRIVPLETCLNAG